MSSIKVMVYGGAGAVISCAWSLYSSQNAWTPSDLVEVLLVEPLTALSPVALGFFMGTVILAIMTLLRALAVRFLLSYNGWFLNRKSPLNKVRPVRKYRCSLVCVDMVCVDAGFAGQEEPWRWQLPTVSTQPSSIVY